MNLGDFHSIVRTTCRRGTTLDADIPTAVRQAAKSIERRFTFSYMRGYYDNTLAAGDSSIVNWSSFELSQIKVVLSARIVLASLSDQIWLKRVNERDFLDKPTERPKAFWQLKSNEIFFNSIADQAYPMQFQVALYTNWPTNLSSAPSIFDEAEDIMLYRTMMNMGVVMRDTMLTAHYKGLYDFEIGTLVEAQVDRDEQSSDHRMQYGTIYE